jgi:hypothetical protein
VGAATERVEERPGDDEAGQQEEVEEGQQMIPGAGRIASVHGTAYYPGRHHSPGDHP